MKSFRLADHVPDVRGHEVAGRNSQFALAACAQAWQAAGIDAAALDLDRVGIYLGSGEGSLDFDAFTSANLMAWNAATASVDTVKFAQLATELMNATRELEQEPNMPLSHLALMTGARGPR